MFRAGVVQSRAVRHGAGVNAFDLNHLIGGDDGDGRGNHVAVEIGIGHVDEVAVGRDVGSGGEEAKAGVLDDFIAAGAVFPDGTVGAAVAFGNVEELFVGGDGDAVGAVYVHGHQAGADLTFDVRAAGAKAEQDNLVGGFADYIDEIVLRGRLGRCLSGQRAERHE